MATYTYRCKECNHEFEINHSMKDEPLKKCPECKLDTLRRVISHAPGIAFKGSGFYVTDSSAKNTQAESKPAKKKAVPNNDKTGSDAVAN